MFGKRGDSGDITIRNVDRSVLLALEAQAKARGRSREAYVREILEKETQNKSLAAIFARGRERVAGIEIPDAAELIWEDRNER